jgi:dephospho-CoA kinase
MKRKRADDPQQHEEFVERDRRELAFGLGNAIARADAVIVNDSTIDAFREKCTEFFERWNSNV